MGTIDLTKAKEMVKRYTDTRRAMIDKEYGMRDTKAIWFSMDQVNAFVASLPTDTTTGVRIYFGVYPLDEPDYSFQTTIIAIGTVAGPDGTNVDPIGSPDSSYLGAAQSQSAYNHGSLCPPNTECTN